MRGARGVGTRSVSTKVANPLAFCRRTKSKLCSETNGREASENAQGTEFERHCHDGDACRVAACSVAVSTVLGHFSACHTSIDCTSQAGRKTTAWCRVTATSAARSAICSKRCSAPLFARGCRGRRSAGGSIASAGSCVSSATLQTGSRDVPFLAWPAGQRSRRTPSRWRAARSLESMLCVEWTSL